MKFSVQPNYKNYNYMLALFLCDTAAYLLAVFFAYETRLIFQEIFDIITLQFSLVYFIFEFWWIYFIYLIFIMSFGLYSRRMPFWKESREIVRATSATFILVFAFVSISKMSEDISRLTILFIWLYSCLFMLFFRYYVKRLLSKFSFFLEKAVIVGDYEAAETAADAFTKEPYLGFQIIGVVTIDKNTRSVKRKYKILGHIGSINRVLIKDNISAAVILPEFKSRYDMGEFVGKLQIMLEKIILLPTVEGLAFSNAETFQTLVGRLAYFQLNNNLKSFFNRFIKRTIDIILGVLALPFVLVISFIIGVCIKATSSGPVFYTHGRVGRGGRTIKILKFRSMYRDADKRLRDILNTDEVAKAEWDKSFKLKDDPRVTGVGKFLRQTSLDELPQIFNVLTGDMSMIGPRPVLQEELDNYYKKCSSYYLMVRPGITGLWQISGRSNTGYDFRIVMDTWYVLNWSIWLDLVILLKTPSAVFKKDGAY